MFEFTVRYLGFLKHVPLLPHLFDVILRLWTLVTNRELMNCLDDIEEEVLSWPATTVQSHKFGGVQFNFQHKEIGHIHGNGILDILFSREIKASLIKNGRASDHHIFKNSGWISFYIRGHVDKSHALELLRQAYSLRTANR